MKINFKQLTLLVLTIISAMNFIIWLLFPQLVSFAEQLFYWLILLYLLDLIFIFKPRSQVILYTALLMTLMGAFLNIVGLLGTADLAEVTLRISLIFWIVGIGYLMLSFINKRD